MHFYFQKAIHVVQALNMIKWKEIQILITTIWAVLYQCLGDTESTNFAFKR